jgi:hypothetical protein
MRSTCVVCARAGLVLELEEILRLHDMSVGPADYSGREPFQQISITGSDGVALVIITTGTTSMGQSDW